MRITDDTGGEKDTFSLPFCDVVVVEGLSFCPDFLRNS
jgi:hypothetical protein